MKRGGVETNRPEYSSRCFPGTEVLKMLPETARPSALSPWETRHGTESGALTRFPGASPTVRQNQKPLLNDDDAECAFVSATCGAYASTSSFCATSLRYPKYSATSFKGFDYNESFFGMSTGPVSLHGQIGVKKRGRLRKIPGGPAEKVLLYLSLATERNSSLARGG